MSGLEPTSNAIRDALEQMVSCRIRALERRPSPFRSSFVLEELDVRLEDGTRLQLVLKRLEWAALLEAARDAKPVFLQEPMREIQVYRNILAGFRLGTAICYGAVIDPKIDRYWLFLEKVPGTELYQLGDFSAWQQAARWLAGLHSRFFGRAENLMRMAPLLRHDADFYRRWLERAREFSRSRTMTDSARQQIEWLARRYDRVIDRLTALPVTLIHGEFYASNILIQEAPPYRVCPIDWEMAAVGPGLMDLAALTAGNWNAQERTALAEAYRSRLAGRAGPGHDFLVLLDHCRLQTAIQWLGWSPDWSPPPQQAQDWLRVALELAERLLQ
jgi:thiamine kinase-like enzyme